MKRTIYALLCLLMAAASVSAQDMNLAGTGLYRHQRSIQLTAGTQGVGAEFNYGLTNNLALRTGVSFIPLTMNNAFPISGLSADSKITANFSNAHLLADFTPIKSFRFLRLVAGAAYFIQAKGSFYLQPNKNYNYGDIVLTPDQVGSVNLDADWKGIAPYAGLGLVNIFPRRGFNVNLDLGGYYLSQPRTTIIGTGILDDNASQNAQFERNMSAYRFLPVLQLNFNFKL